MGQTLPWQLDAALRQPAVAVLHTITSDTGALPIETVVEVAHEHAVPVVVDAAAELPPVTNLSRFLLAGADVVVFSGGKAIRGPQASGLLLGRADLVRSVRAQQDDTDADRELTLARTGRVLWQQGIGRAMKVSCETMLALELALKRFVTRDHDAEARDMSTWLSHLRVALGSGRLVGESTGEGFYPSLVFEFDDRHEARIVWQELAARTPSVRLCQSELVERRLRVRPEALDKEGRGAVWQAMSEVASRLP